MSRQTAHGVSVELPRGWNGQIYRRRDADDLDAGVSAARARPEEQSGAIVRAATVPIELDDGDFGGGVVQRLGGLDAFFVLFEYTVDDKLTPGRGLFASRRVPWPLRPEEFSSRTLHIRLPGHAGLQHFFTAEGRPFCLYAVIGSGRRRRATVAGLNGVLGSISIDPPT